MALTFEFDWDSAVEAAAPELRSTWAQLSIRADGECITTVEDAGGALRRHLNVALYPLAEWIAYNWWQIRFHRRPRFLNRRSWSHQDRSKLGRSSSSWLQGQNMRAVQDGFPWPDLSILPDGIDTLLVWQRDRARRPSSTVRFTSSGEFVADSDQVTAELARVVEAVIARLREDGVKNVPLIDEWEHIRAMDSEEVQFCVAASRLGVDPMSASETLADDIVRISNQLTGRLFEDFIDAADPGSLASDLEWLQRARGQALESTASTERLPKLDPTTPPQAESWLLGQKDARRFRDALGVEATARLDLSPFIEQVKAATPSRRIDSLGAVSPRGSSVLTSGTHKTQQADRFSVARSAWQFARGEREFLISSARTAVQRAERAFAAEVLAPTSGIKELLSEPADSIDLVSLDEVRSISDHYDVNEWVVEYQIENNLGVRVDDPGLERV